MDFESYQHNCELIIETNYQLLDLFEEDLLQSGLTSKTINRHLSNVDFYINKYLLLEEPHSMEYGVSMIDGFLGDFFIRKCMWSTPGNIKSTAASIKKFYKSMLAHGKIDKKSYNQLCSEIKNGMESWQMNCEIYNDPDSPNPFYCF